MSELKLFIKYLIIIALFTNCSASTGSRYSEGDNPDDKKNKSTESAIVEDFDITPYKADLTINKTGEYTNISEDAWFDYEKFSDDVNPNINRKITGTTDGYRIVVIATDNMEEANSLREVLRAKLKTHEIYISFEPPFYKVKVGDFTNLAETNDLKFKLNQFGYKEARIVQETVNLFEE